LKNSIENELKKNNKILHDETKKALKKVKKNKENPD
jgi:hypothetical protein